MNHRTSYLTAVFVLLAIATMPTVARADWKRIRDLVRSADAITNKAEKEKVLRKAYAEAKESVRKAPKVSNEYLWLSNAAGRLAQAVGTKERIALSKVVKDNAEKAIALDAKNGPAYMTLGAWHYYVADLSWFERTAAKAFYGGVPSASFEKAVANLTLALKHGVENPVEVYFLRAHAHEELDHDAQAASDYRACIASAPRNDAERAHQKRAREKLD
ncbi:MAG: hypothetical protein H7X80_08460 [bacterium]|nr:hypothetical protein [Candidatus Kapabacteria bacterium]